MRCSTSNGNEGRSNGTPASRLLRHRLHCLSPGVVGCTLADQFAGARPRAPDADAAVLMRRLLVAAVLVLLETSCALPLRRICADGWPVKILQHPECPHGICGYTCQPDRWRA